MALCDFAVPGITKCPGANGFHRFGAPQKELFTQTGFFRSKARGVEKGAKKNENETAIPTSK